MVFYFYLHHYEVDKLLSPHCKTAKPRQTPPQTIRTESVLVKERMVVPHKLDIIVPGHGRVSAFLLVVAEQLALGELKLKSCTGPLV